MKLKVAVAVIRDEQERILITQRPSHVPQGGLWEFPGGKLEKDESAESALVREIKEEIGIDVLHYQFLGSINYQYPDKAVELLIFHVTSFTGTPNCLENQLNMKWITKEHFDPDVFPEANRGIFDLIPATI